ncbi:MAG: tripartite tricarboxylate transporter substrate binding protein [Betaproteobacteria bacterium]|nr:tripartite tricarboxylate transporter substrate binding protein [Betaproteobacteria bacterium]
MKLHRHRAPRAPMLLLAVFLMAALAPRAALAQADVYPSKPIRLIVTFAPGGSVDVVARLVAPKLSEKLGQQLVIENRAGASGIIGTEAVATSRPDGYTLMMHTIPFVANQFLYAKVPYTLADFAPISLVTSSPGIVAVHPSVPARNVRELLALAKAKPGTLNYSSAGAGTNPHIAGELFNMLGNVDIVPIHYKGGGPALAALLAGEVSVSFNNMAEAAPHVKTGKIRALGVTGAKRTPVFPDLPTVAESGIPGYEFTTWNGLLAPKGTPDAIVRLINDKLKEALRSPDMVQRFEQMGLDNVAGTPEQFAASLKTESEKWGKVIKERNIRVE